MTGEIGSVAFLRPKMKSMQNVENGITPCMRYMEICQFVTYNGPSTLKLVLRMCMHALLISNSYFIIMYFELMSSHLFVIINMSTWCLFTSINRVDTKLMTFKRHLKLLTINTGVPHIIDI